MRFAHPHQEATMRYPERLGFHAGSDEMYMHISGLAVRLSWLTLVVLLLGWSVYDALRFAVLPVQFLVLAAGELVYWVVYAYVQRNLTRSHEK
jgi:hypothetical protein